MLAERLAPERVDPRVKRTRQMLEQAFVELTHEKGFQALTVQDITERAGVNRATFYAHFADKYALLDHYFRQGFVAEIDKRMLHACHISDENLCNLIVAVCEYTRATNGHCKPAQPQFEALVETQVKSVLHELLLKWLTPDEEGARRPRPSDAERAATAASWAIYGLGLQWSHEKKPVPAEQFAHEVMPVVAGILGVH